MLKEPPILPKAAVNLDVAERKVTADRPNHVWHVDLTAVPIHGGFWASWLPSALPQCWPFYWWVAVVIDHFSRRVMEFTLYIDQPTSLAVRKFLGRTISQSQAGPKYLICDKGVQFWCDEFKVWCRRRKIKPRFGAVHKHSSLAVIERFILILQNEGTRRILVSLRRDHFQCEIKLFRDWYNECRPQASSRRDAAASSVNAACQSECLREWSARCTPERGCRVVN